MSELVDVIEFRATAKKTSLPMLDEATAKLRAIGTQLDALNGKLAGLSTMSAFKRSKAEIEDLLRSAAKTKSLPIKSVGEMLGLPDLKDFQAFVSRFKSLHKDLRSSFFTGKGGSEFASVRSAAEVVRKYQTAAQARSSDVVGQLQALLGGGSSLPGRGTVATPPIQPPIQPPRLQPVPQPSKRKPKAAEENVGNFRDAMAAINREMNETIAAKNARGVAGSGDPLQIAAARAKAAAQIRGLVGKSDLPEGGAASENALAKAAKLESGAEDLRQKLMADSMKRVGAIREELARARERGDKEEAKRLNSERRQMEKRIKSQNQMLGAGQKSEEAKAKGLAAVAAFDQKQAAARQAVRDASIRRQVSHASAEGALADFLAVGGTIDRESATRRVGKNGMETGREVQASRQFGGKKEIFTATFDSAGASVKKLTRDLSEARAEAGYLAGDFVKNTAKVTLWAASVGVLYKSLELAGYSMARVIDIGAQMARLDQVFRGVGGSTQQLTSDILHLAAVNGRSTQEAMDSAVQWSRLGLTRSQVNEAVRVSLMAANVAELSAADATEHLQAVMQNYQLQVGELGTVLGQLNQISNTYNVTNADLMQGLSRTAAVAKQAGLPLAELMGLIGATVGSTGQTGANIGNAIKSITVALGNPILQKGLRAQFGFETSTGGEDIKNLSVLLSDLYVKYQHLNEAQQRSLLFQVAGKNQASRLSALLDSYVRAQTLAINAQLNLNSAETENAKIKGALRSQLQGLTSEWERFVVIQGNRGPVQVLTQMSAAMRNLLTLMNTRGGSMATTGILGLLLAGGAKSVLTGMQLKSGGGFLSRSGNAVRGALGGMNQSMMAAYAQVMGGGLGTNVKTGQLGIFGAQKASSLYVWSEALLRVGRSSAVSSAGVRGLATAMGATTRALGAGLLALRAWLVPLGVIALATVGFNLAMEGLGLSSQAAESKLAGFNEEAQRAASAANAFAQAAELMRTAQNALKPEKGFANMRPEDQSKMLSQVAEGMFVNEGDLTRRQKLTEEARAQLELMRQQGDLQGIQGLLEERRNKLIEERRGKLQEEFEAIKRQESATDAEVKKLKSVANGPLGFIGADSRRNKITELERRQSDLSGDKTRNILDQSNAFEERLHYDEKHQTALESHKLTLESIAEIFNQIGTNNPFDKMLVRLASLDAQLGAIHSRRQELTQQDEQGLASEAEMDRALKEIQARKAAARGELAQMRPPSPLSLVGKVLTGNPEGLGTVGKMLNTSDTYQKIKAKRDEIAKLEDEETRAKAGRLPAGEVGFASRQEQRKQLEEEERNLKAQRDALRNNRGLVGAQTQFGFGVEQSRRAVIPAGYGFDEADRLQRTRRALETDNKRLEAKPNRDLSDDARLLENQRQLYQTILALRERAYTVERDINQLVFDRTREFQRSLFDAGPNELLRKLAAFRAAFDGKGGLRNLSAGAMMSFSPEFRHDVTGAQYSGVASGQKPPGVMFDPAMIDLLTERGRLKSFQGEGMGKEFDRYQMEISGKIGALAEQLSKALGNFSLDTFNAAAAVMGTLANKVNDAVLPALDAFAAKLNALTPATASAKSGQYGGRGAGAGY